MTNQLLSRGKIERQCIVGCGSLRISPWRRRRLLLVFPLLLLLLLLKRRRYVDRLQQLRWTALADVDRARLATGLEPRQEPEQML